MLTNLKKLVALSGAVAIVAMNFVPAGVGAAAVNDGVANTTTSPGNITITSVSITGTSVTVRVEKDGVVVPGITATASTGSITVLNPDANSDLDM